MAPTLLWKISKRLSLSCVARCGQLGLVQCVSELNLGTSYGKLNLIQNILRVIWTLCVGRTACVGHLDGLIQEFGLETTIGKLGNLMEKKVESANGSEFGACTVSKGLGMGRACPADGSELGDGMHSKGSKQLVAQNWEKVGHE